MIKHSKNTEQSNSTKPVLCNGLKASDLRIGNLIQFGNKFKKVVEIIEDAFYVLYKDGTTLKNTWADLKPIPLTEKRLLDFGFIIDETYVSEENPFLDYIKDEVRISMPYFSFEYGDGAFMELKYVHQLQNLYFALTQRELTVA